MIGIQSTLLIAPSVSDSSLSTNYRQPAVDVIHLVADNLNIADARQLVATAATKPVNSEYKVIVVCFKRATIEAQNALLKLLEEPPATIKFFIIVPHASVLLPTVLSRLVSEEQETSAVKPLSPETEEFLAASPASRIALIAAKHKAKETEWMSKVVHELATMVAAKPQKFASATLSSLLTAESYVDIRGASRKSLLEHVALTLPSKL